MSRITNYFTALQDIDPDAQAFFDACSISDLTEKNAVNTMVLALKDKLLWNNKMVAIYPISPTSLNAASCNLRDPSKFQITYVNSPPHSSTGVDWDGLTQFGKPGIIPSVDLTDNNVHLSYYSRENIAESGFEMGIDTPSRFNLIIRFSNTAFWDSYNNSGGRVTGVNTDSRGLCVGSRRSSTDSEVYMRGLSLATIATGGGVVPSLEFFIGCVATNITPTNFSTKECAFASVGLGLTDTDVTNLTNIVQVYQTNVIAGGRQV